MANPEKTEVMAKLRPLTMPTKPFMLARRSSGTSSVTSPAASAAAATDAASVTSTAKGMTPSTVEAPIVAAVRQQNFDDEVIHDHVEIARAIVDGKADKARKLMKEHVEHIISHFEEFLPHTIGAKVALG